MAPIGIHSQVVLLRTEYTCYSIYRAHTMIPPVASMSSLYGSIVAIPCFVLSRLFASRLFIIHCQRILSPSHLHTENYQIRIAKEAFAS